MVSGVGGGRGRGILLVFLFYLGLVLGFLGLFFLDIDMGLVILLFTSGFGVVL